MFSFARPGPTVAPVFFLSWRGAVQHRPANLNQLPTRAGLGGSMAADIKTGTEAGVKGLEGAAVCSRGEGAAVTEFLLCLAPAGLPFFQSLGGWGGSGGYF